MEEEIAKRSPNFDKPLLVFEQQIYRSEREMMEQAIRQTYAGLANINQLKRSPAPLSKLCLEWNAGHPTVFLEFPPIRQWVIPPI